MLPSELSDNELIAGAQNSVKLKDHALQMLQTVCGENWTDHNPADPGITLLEVLAFVISDLGYRLNFPIQDLLAPNKSLPEDRMRTQFLDAIDILPSNAITQADIRHTLLGVYGVKNVTITSSWRYKYESGLLKKTEALPYKSIDLILELENDLYYSADLPHFKFGANKLNGSDGSINKSIQDKRKLVLNQVVNRFLSLRNVNQDINSIIIANRHSFNLVLDISLENVIDPVAKVIEIFRACREIIYPKAQAVFATDLIDQGMSPDEIMNGVVLHDQVYLDDSTSVSTPAANSASTQTDWIYVSDVLDRLNSIEGISNIYEISFSPIVNSDGSPSSDDPNFEQSYLNWRYRINSSSVPHLDSQSVRYLRLTVDGQVYSFKDAELDYIIQSIDEPSVVPASIDSSASKNLEGKYRELKDYQSIQDEFPKIYSLIDSSLNREINSGRKAEILQFKGYLTIFDQFLSDQFAQLENLRKLLAIPDSEPYSRLSSVFNKMLASEYIGPKEVEQFWLDVRALPLTQLSQPILKVSGLNHLLADYLSTYQKQGFQALSEPLFNSNQLNRLSRALDHLMARYSEKRLDSNLLKYRQVFTHYLEAFSNVPSDFSQNENILERLVLLKQIVDQVNILVHYPDYSKKRGGGFSYWDTQPIYNHIGGLAKRIMGFLGFSHPGQMPLATKNRESFYLIESELLRFGHQDDYQSNQVYFIVPRWPTRLNNKEFYNLLRTSIARDTPVHNSVFMIDLDRREMSLFERLYFAWLNAMTRREVPVFESDLQLNPTINEDSQFIVERLTGYLRLFLSKQCDLLELLMNDLVRVNDGLDWDLLIDRILERLLPGAIIKLKEPSYADIESETSRIIKSYPDEYSELSSKDIFFEIAHEYLEEMFNPNPISKAVIGNNFRVGYQYLDYLKPCYPLAYSKINPENVTEPEFTVNTTPPNQI